MVKRRLTALLVGMLGLAASAGCQDLNYNCVGICGDTVGNGDFEGVISAASEVDALNQCTARLACDAGFEPNCNCYLSETEARAPANPQQ